jgi:hypothetical protein
LFDLVLELFFARKRGRTNANLISSGKVGFESLNLPWLILKEPDWIYFNSHEAASWCKGCHSKIPFASLSNPTDDRAAIESNVDYRIMYGIFEGR